MLVLAVQTMDWSTSVKASTPSARRVSFGDLELRGELRLAIQMGIGGVEWVWKMDR